jgi:hypothetical protein
LESDFGFGRKGRRDERDDSVPAARQTKVGGPAGKLKLKGREEKKGKARQGSTGREAADAGSPVPSAVGSQQSAPDGRKQWTTEMFVAEQGPHRRRKKSQNRGKRRHTIHF